jgi:4-hydroxy-4-methyl-2-oxoglutarate aldolase
MNRFGGLDGNIRPAGPGMRLAGPAVTVRVAAGSNLMVYAAFRVAQPGDVLVIETRGFTAVAQWGDVTSRIACRLGLGGMVTDGSLRDVRGIREAGLPVFAASWTVPNGALKHGPGEVNVPVALGGVPVLPGDVVVGDEAGVVVVPRRDAEAVLSRSRAMAAAEAAKVRAFDQGRLLPEGLADQLREQGCETVDRDYFAEPGGGP